MFKASIRNGKDWLATHLFAYDGRAVVAALRRLGLKPGDTLMVHSAWSHRNGFQGKPSDLIGALKETVGANGLLVMPSLTYHNESSTQFLARKTPMDVRRSPSRMGFLTEVFRRGKDVVRSLSPTHPLLAWGSDAAAFVAGHEKVIEPFGDGSPFERLLQRDAVILGFDVPFSTFTFTHFVEARISSRLPFSFWEPVPVVGTVIDSKGRRIDCLVRVISAQAHSLRREERLVARLQTRYALQRVRLGNTTLLFVRCRHVLAAAEEMLAEGRSFFDAPPGGSVGQTG